MNEHDEWIDEWMNKEMLNKENEIKKKWREEQVNEIKINSK